MAALLSLFLLWFAIAVRQQKGYFDGTYFPVLSCAILLGIAAIAVWLKWTGSKWIAFIAGIVLCLLVVGVWYIGLLFGVPAFSILMTPILLFVAVTGFALISKDSEPT